MAVLDSRPTVQIKNGGLEATTGDKFVGFNWQDDPGVTTFADRSVHHQGKVACRFEPGKIVNGQTSTNVRLTQTVKLRPQYGLSFLLLGEDPKPGADGFVSLAGAGCRCRRAAAYVSRGWSRIDPRLEATRGRL